MPAQINSASIPYGRVLFASCVPRGTRGTIHLHGFLWSRSGDDLREHIFKMESIDGRNDVGGLRTQEVLNSAAMVWAMGTIWSEAPLHPDVDHLLVGPYVIPTEGESPEILKDLVSVRQESPKMFAAIQSSKACEFLVEYTRTAEWVVSLSEL